MPNVKCFGAIAFSTVFLFTGLTDAEDILFISHTEVVQHPPMTPPTIGSIVLLIKNIGTGIIFFPVLDEN